MRRKRERGEVWDRPLELSVAKGERGSVLNGKELFEMEEGQTRRTPGMRERSHQEEREWKGERRRTVLKTISEYNACVRVGVRGDVDVELVPSAGAGAF